MCLDIIILHNVVVVHCLVVIKRCMHDIHSSKSHICFCLPRIIVDSIMFRQGQSVGFAIEVRCDPKCEVLCRQISDHVQSYCTLFEWWHHELFILDTYLYFQHSSSHIVCVGANTFLNMLCHCTMYWTYIVLMVTHCFLHKTQQHVHNMYCVILSTYLV